MGKFATTNNAQPVNNTQVTDEVYNVVDDMSTSNKFWAGMGKSFVDTGRGVADLVYDAIPGEQWGEESLNNSIAESRKLDAPLMETKAGMGGNIAGSIATFAPTAFVPGVNTYTGSALVAAAMGALQPTLEDDSRVVNTAIAAPLGILGKWGGDKIAQSAKTGILNQGIDKVQNVVKDATIKSARAVGYKIPPSQANPSVISNTLEGLSGKAQTGQHASVANQRTTDQLARKALGLKESAPLTSATLKTIRKEEGVHYENLKKIGSIVTDDQYLDDIGRATQEYSSLIKEFPTMAVKQIDDLLDDVTRDGFDSSNMVNLVKKLRFQASKNMKSLDDPAKAQLGQTQKKIATSLEDLVERNIGDPSALSQFKAARARIAKSYAIDDALNPASGHVEAGVLGKMASKGEPLTDELKVIADMSLVFPKAVQSVDKLSGVLGTSPIDWMAASGAALATGNPGMLGLLATRPLARSALLSKPFQAAMTKPNYNASAQKIMKGIMESTSGQHAARTLPAAGGILAF